MAIGHSRGRCRGPLRASVPTPPPLAPPLSALPPSGNRIEYAGVAISRIAGGKIADVWVLGDRLALIEQIERTADT